MKKINRFGCILLTIVSVCTVITTSCNNGKDYYDEGVSYITGKDGVPQDLEKAEQLLMKAVQKNYVPAYYQIGRIYAKRGSFDEMLNWYDKAATAGDKKTAKLLGDLYTNSDEVKSDEAKAILYYNKALEMGKEEKEDAIIHQSLGYLYCEEKCLDMDKAIQHFTKATELDDTMAECFHNLGAIYAVGIGGVKKNYGKAVPFFKKAADLDYVESLWNLTICYENGFGVDRDREQAIAYASRAADQGHELAKTYLKQVGVRRR